jgi:hypothetical protein
MPAYNAKFIPSGFRHCDMKTQDGRRTAGRHFRCLGCGISVSFYPYIWRTSDLIALSS